MVNNLFLDNVKWNAIGYARLSDDDIDKDVSNSIVNQTKLIQRRAKEDSSINLVDIVYDDGYTGTNFNRPAFIDMMEKLSSKEVNCVIVKDLSRFGRDSSEVCTYLQKKYPSQGIRFISVKEKLDSYTQQKRMTGYEVLMYSVVHEIYPIDTSNKTRMSLAAKRQDGQFTGSIVPYGYLRDLSNKNKLIVDEAVRDNIIEIFKMYINGESIRNIADTFTKNSIVSPLAHSVENGLRKLPKNTNLATYKNWSVASVRKILNCEILTGDMVQGKTTSISHKVKNRIPLPRSKWDIVKNTHEAIISMEMFNTVQELLNKKQRPIHNGKTIPSPLAGYMFCLECGAPMVRNIKTINGVKYKKFCCSTSKKHGKTVCSSHFIDEDVVQEVVLFSIQSQIANLENLENTINKLSYQKQIGKATAYLNIQKQELLQKLAEANKLIKDIYADFKKELISIEEYKNLNPILNDDKVEIESKIDILDKQMIDTNNVKNQYSKYVDDFIKYKNVDKLNRSIIVSLVEKITIDEEKNIEVVFKYQDVFKKFSSIFAK